MYRNKDKSQQTQLQITDRILDCQNTALSAIFQKSDVVQPFLTTEIVSAFPQVITDITVMQALSRERQTIKINQTCFSVAFIVFVGRKAG